MHTDLSIYVMESKRYQNLYPELSPSKDDESFDNRRPLTDEDAAFCRELEKVKMLSIITAQQEEKQRQLEKSMPNSCVQPQVPILKPPPRQPRQHIDSLSEASKGFARPKPILNPPTNETSGSVKTAQISGYLTVDVNPRSHSVPPLFKNEETTDAVRVSNDLSNKELIQLSPAISDRSVNVDFDVRQLDPLFSGTNVGYTSSAPPPIGFCNFTIPKSSEPSNFMPFATIPRKNYSFTSSDEIGKLTQTGNMQLHGFDLPVNQPSSTVPAQVPPPLPAKAPRGQWNTLIMSRDPWQPNPRFSFPPPPPLPPSSKHVQGFQLPIAVPALHLPILPSPVSSGSLLSFANNNLAIPNRSGNPFSASDSNITRQFSNPFFGFSDNEKDVEDGSREPNGMNNNDIDDDNDLIHFPDSMGTNHLINPTYMSLADFDPLFDMQNQAKAKKSKKPDRSKREGNAVKTSDCSDPVLPRRKVISLPTTSSIENNAGYPVLEQRVSIIPASWSFSPDSTRPNVNNEIQVFRVATNVEHSGNSFDFDWEDPDDPFSICHLVRKSKRHQQQQQRKLTTSESSSQPFEVKEAHMRTHPINKYASELLEESPETADEEIRAFLQMVARIKLLHPIDDTFYNSGIVISPQTVHKQYINLTVKLIITGSFVPDELVFVSDVNSTVEHVIIQSLMLLVDDGNISPDSYIFKVFGHSEYLINKSLLSDYEYVQQCLKLGKDIKFIIQQVELIQRPFQRTAEDINHPVYVPKVLSADDSSSRLTMNKLNILLETFYKECEKLKTLVLQNKVKVNCSGVVQSVKAICTMMNSIETVDVTKAISRLKMIVSDNEALRSPTGSSNCIREACVYETNDTSTTSPRQYSDLTRRCIDTSSFMDDLQSTLNELLRSIKCLVDMFCRTFHKEFRFKSFMVQPKEFCDISSLNDFLIVHLATAHRIPNNWRNVHSEFFVQCRIYNGGHQVGREVWTQGVLSSASLNQPTITWDEWLTFDDVRICDLPREAKLCFTLIGCRMTQNSTNDGQTKIRRILAWVAIQIFNHQFELVQGDHLLGMWPGSCSAIAPTTDTNTHSSSSVLLQVSMQNFDHLCTFPKIEEMNSAKQDFDMLHPDDQNLLLSLIERDPIVKMSEDEKEFLWQKRHYLYGIPSALPKVLQSITSWACYSLSETYTMIRDWTPMGPMQSLQLLLPRFSDMIVRCLAVDKLRELPADDFCDLLPQLVQALKFEFYHTSALARLLLERSATSVRVAHHVYWLLKDAADDVHHRKRYQLMFGALMSVVGEKMRNEFGKQEEFVNMLAAIAEKVKAAKDKDAVLQRELCNMWDFLQHKSVRLPTNPALEVAGVDVKSCSFFTSFTVPLKLAFKNIDPSAGDIYVMFKAGDDLRQDALTLQMIRIMDRLWLQDGLDLKVVTFKCLPTSLKKGFVELIPESDTLGKIQKKHGHGVTGSFKDRPIAEWLQMHNPSELDYQAAVDNFTASCAGYCVATYVLGVCDRHNDNIMIKHSGHIFHIDYAKFLGDLQMLGAINRDRTPFILTSDMAYVINGGDKPTEKFQKFVDLCCHALNIIRRNSGLFINLFSLMTLSGVPRVNEDAPRYVREALMPERSDAEAVAEFTRMVNTSLKSIFTQFNFFIHNLAQLKFSGHDEGMLLSFVPKTYSLSIDGRIKNLELHGIQKRYNPEKFYIFIVKVERLNQKVPSFVLRRFSEFQELHRKLVATFPLVQWPSLSGKIILGRAHVKAVAESRKAELEVFLKSLLKMSSEVAEHDLVYTFFHPMLRDEQENKTNLLKLKDTQPSPVTSTNRFVKPIEGSIKLSIFYKPHGLTVMVMHVKDLGKTSNGELPSPYVKLYLLPDPMKQTKRKTKIAKNTSHPTYNEMLIYRIQAEQAVQKVLQVTVWSYDGLKENEFLGGVHVRLAELDFTRECISWYKLQNLHMMSMSSSMS